MTPRFGLLGAEGGSEHDDLAVRHCPRLAVELSGLCEIDRIAEIFDRNNVVVPSTAFGVKIGESKVIYPSS